MKRSDGAVLVGVHHSGVANAKRVERAFLENGFRPGMLVAREISADAWDYVKRLLRTGERRSLLQRLHSQFLEVRAALKRKPDDAKLFVLAEELRNVREELGFQIELGRFLLGRKARVLALGDPKLERRLFKRTHRALQLIGRGKSLERYERETDAIRLALTEKGWRKRLGNAKPDFVVGGIAHIPAFKRLVAYRKAVDVSGTAPELLAVLRKRAVAARRAYKRMQEKKKQKAGKRRGRK